MADIAREMSAKVVERIGRGLAPGDDADEEKGDGGGQDDALGHGLSLLSFGDRRLMQFGGARIEAAENHPCKGAGSRPAPRRPWQRRAWRRGPPKP
jgi:hypothetical protein